MANLEFYDTHNMVAYLLKTEGSEGFYQIVDFLNSSHIKYALTENPTIDTLLIQQFWRTAAANTLDTREVQITAIIDGKVKLVFEASIRRHLKLEDYDGINTLPNTKIFEQLALMGYVSNTDKLTFQKGHFSPQWRFLIHTILHCLSPKKTSREQFSSNIATAIICLATKRTFNFSKMIFKGMLKNLDSAPTTSQPHLSSPSKIPTRQETKVPRPSSLTYTHVADEAASIGVDVRHGGAATTVSSLDARQGSGGKLGGRLEANKEEVAKVHTYTRRRTISTASGGISTAEESVSTAGASMGVSTVGMVDKAVRLQEQLDEEERYGLVQLWSLVKERFSTTEPIDNKEKELWVELKRLFELDVDDTLWKLQRYIHDPLVMSSPPAHTIPETIIPTNRARDSPVTTPLHDDPYMLVRLTHPLLWTLNYTPDTLHSDKDLEPMEASETRTVSPSGSTSPLSPNHPLTQTSPTSTPSRAFYYRSTTRMAVRTQPTLSPDISARVIEEMALSPSSFCRRYRSSYETLSSSASPKLSPILPIRKMYQCTSKPILDTRTEGDESEAKGTSSESEEFEDEGPGSESKDATSKEQQQREVLVEDIAANEPLGLGYEAARRHALKLAEGPTPRRLRLPTCRTWVDPEDGTVYIYIEFDAPTVRTPVHTPASPEWSSGYLPILPPSLTVPSPVASPVTTLAAIMAVDEGEFLDVGAQLEIYESILNDHTQRLNALLCTLFEGYGRDFTRLFARSEAVRDKIHSQHSRLGSLYEDQREILALGMQNAANQHEMQELRERLVEGKQMEQDDERGEAHQNWVDEVDMIEARGATIEPDSSYMTVKPQTM
uniref:Synaptobrevin, longin-like domain protein n=1 Tax=Tanacetum cinerariifolium TaxID=118510 RepID=A0A6L2M8T8_TANCI|nr:synaptobrevin, longin-like domain protein [Tanacetum cinerariifolium]